MTADSLKPKSKFLLPATQRIRSLAQGRPTHGLGSIAVNGLPVLKFRQWPVSEVLPTSPALDPQSGWPNDRCRQCRTHAHDPKLSLTTIGSGRSSIGFGSSEHPTQSCRRQSSLWRD